ncbi:hypothetical protein Mycsm_05037 [Mycobacterium sp. JS623]|uniref:hypothetical protein n=1 Tax=Mycobacterium sp. JS623 TaxID=212767 RepID=UPI0002A594D4|nr:hypothetical protein [Mycobacterium sp. JS623]AGB25247.1 hypothetical protein Mycsm_05037 [Mycobacterium sp. JS623]
MRVLTTEEIDRELESRTKEVAAMSSTLVELENHPGLEHVRVYEPTGLTAQRWTVIEKSLSGLWEDLRRMTSILDSARQVRARRSKPDDDDLRELTKLLREPTLEVSRQPIPLAKRKISGLGESIEYVGLADTAERMHAVYPAIVEFLDAVDRVNSLVAEKLAPTRKRLDEAGASGPDDLADLLEVTATDPLSLSTRDIEARINAIADMVERRSAELAELAAIQSNWAANVSATAESLDALREANVRATQIRELAVQKVLAGTFPARSDAEPALRAELAAITSPDPKALRSLRRRIDAALRAAHEEQQLAQGLLDRRTELKGRLTVYQAKAARLGLGEDRDLLACIRIAKGLLSRQPCDLRAVTRAISDYQQMIADKQEKTE